MCAKALIEECKVQAAMSHCLSHGNNLMTRQFSAFNRELNNLRKNYRFGKIRLLHCMNFR